MQVKKMRETKEGSQLLHCQKEQRSKYLKELLPNKQEQCTGFTAGAISRRVKQIFSAICSNLYREGFDFLISVASFQKFFAFFPGKARGWRMLVLFDIYITPGGFHHSMKILCNIFTPVERLQRKASNRTQTTLLKMKSIF